jgi:hypothetical protein
LPISGVLLTEIFLPHRTIGDRRLGCELCGLERAKQVGAR